MIQKKNAYAVIGLGRFGKAVATSLAQNGKSVLALDADQKVVDQIAPHVEACACVDSMDVEALHELELASFQCVIIGIGESAREASILTTAVVSGLGVQRIIARATDSLHEQVLRSVGAHEVINPEAEIGARLGRRLSHPNFLEEFQLGDDIVIIELDILPEWNGRTLSELDLRRKHEITVLGIRSGGKVQANPAGDSRLKQGDAVIALGSPKAIDLLHRAGH
jgi:trk system potassium uptake protein TrkA